jgi:hypothetical protein
MNQILELIFITGLPILAWASILYYWAFHKGYLDLNQTDLKLAFIQLSEQKKAKEVKVDFLVSKWLSFGVGFYGFMAFTTFILIETKEVYGFISQLNSVSDIVHFLTFQQLLQAFIQSFLNLIPAFTWFLTWPGIVGFYGGITWILIVFFGYNLGLHIAKQLHRRELNIDRLNNTGGNKQASSNIR